MKNQDRWNHLFYSVPIENFRLIEECIDTLFPWQKFVRREDLIGYRLQQDQRLGNINFRPTKAASDVYNILDRLRKEHPELAEAMGRSDALTPNFNDHTGFLVKSVDDWEQRVAMIRTVEKERPEFQVKLVAVYLPGRPPSETKDLYQAFIRVGLLGPFRNTFEMQAVKPT